MNKKAVFAFALLALGVTTQAQTVIRVASDSSSGTYAKMLDELVGVCASDQFTIATAQNSGGAVGNLDTLFNNHADAAFMHSDVFMSARGASDEYNQFKTLVALWPEAINVVTLRTSKTKKNGTLSWGTVTINTLQDTAGYAVGAAGGGVVTARVLTSQGQGGFTVQEYPSGGDVIAALDRGEIAAAIFVGAAPLPNLEKLNKTHPGVYKVIPLGEGIASKVSGIYRPAQINYPGLTNGVIPTMAPLATLITKRFQTTAKINAQRALRQCVSDHLGDLQDGYSRNWSQVKAGDEGTLGNYLDLPATTSTPTRKH